MNRGTVRIMTEAEREALYGPIIRQAFRLHGLLPSWGMAIAKHESNFCAKAVADTGGDAKLGNAWGLCQMTYDTAHVLGYVGQPQGLADPQTNASLAAQLFRRNSAILNTLEFSKLAAAYNCGPGHVRADTIPASTQEYVKQVTALQQQHYAHYDLERDT